MVTVADVTPCESRKLTPNRGRWQPHIDVGRGEGGWYWRLRLVDAEAGTNVPTRWRGAYMEKTEALAAGVVNFNLVCAIKDGALMQRFEAAALDPVDVVREGTEK